MAKETQIKLTKTRYRLGCLGVTNICGFIGFSVVASAGWLPVGWLPQSGFPSFRKRIQHGKIVIQQPFDNESLFPKSSGR